MAVNYSKGFLRIYLFLSACWIAAWVYAGVKKSPDLQLSAARRQELDAVVRQMMEADETDDDIQPVVDDFQRKYGKRSWALTVRRILPDDTLAIALIPPVVGFVALIALPWVGRGFRSTKT